MKDVFKERVDINRYCLRKISGFICIIAGIAVIFIKVFHFIAHHDVVPFDGRGQFLVGTGAALLGLTGLDGLFSGREK